MLNKKESEKERKKRQEIYDVVYSGDLAFVKEKLESGYDINEYIKYARTMLSISTSCSKNDTALYLIEAGADMEKSDYNNVTPLMYAVQANKLELVKKMVSCGANLEVRDSNGRTALSYAACYSSLEIVRYLIEEGAIVESKDNQGWSILSYAAWNKDGAAEYLLSKYFLDINVLFVDNVIWEAVSENVKMYIKNHMHLLNEKSLKIWKAYRLKQLFT